MSIFEVRLNQARNGNGILFCGAGLTADCLNFDPDVQIGVGSHLLQILNEELTREGHTGNYRNIRNAAEAFTRHFGESKLMSLLIERFNIQNVSADVVDVMQFPWDRIYTTNYDNGIEYALRRAQRKHTSFNNLDDPAGLTASLAVIHLHGFIEKWNLDNFRSSCILTTESYHRLDSVTVWLDLFRRDIERAEIVLFVGFSADDFHLNDVLFNANALREKVFFINQVTAEPDPDIQMTQERFGQPSYIGRSGLAKTISRITREALPKEPTLASFRRYNSPEAEAGLPSVSDIEDLFLFGKVNQKQVVRDSSGGRSDYHVRRSLGDEILGAVEEHVSVILVLGEICDGKTLLFEDLCDRLSVSRPVFRLWHSHETLLDEVARIRHVYPTAVLVIENCFEIREERLLQLSHTFDGSDGCLLLSSRNIAAEAEMAAIQGLRAGESFREYHMGQLNDDEVDALIPLVDQIAGWRHLQATMPVNKKQFVVRECKGSLPKFLLQLLKSQHVRDRYKEEYNKTTGLSGPERTAIIVALYIGHHCCPTKIRMREDLKSSPVLRWNKRKPHQQGGSGPWHTIIPYWGKYSSWCRDMNLRGRRGSTTRGGGCGR